MRVIDFIYFLLFSVISAALLALFVAAVQWLIAGSYFLGVSGFLVSSFTMFLVAYVALPDGDQNESA